MGILTTDVRNKKYNQILNKQKKKKKKTSPYLHYVHKRGARLHTPFPNARSENGLIDPIDLTASNKPICSSDPIISSDATTFNDWIGSNGSTSLYDQITLLVQMT